MSQQEIDVLISIILALLRESAPSMIQLVKQLDQELSDDSFTFQMMLYFQTEVRKISTQYP